MKGLVVKLNHLRRPIQTAHAFKDLFETRLNMWKFANHGARRFKGDARFDLQNVTDGFLNQIDESSDDAELLERISAAYIRTVEQQERAPEVYRASEWWQQVRQRSLGPVIQALLTRDIDSLRRMYRNFYRDPCSAGLLGAPNGMSKAYFGGKIKDVDRRFYLSHVLYRFDYWSAQTEGRFTLRDLAGPGVGNPFGVRINGSHISVGAEYTHYCAHRIDGLLDSETTVVAEIGGGFGGMAYYLLRDRPKVTYLDFDNPESIALSSYYLMTAFPSLKFLLYGEEALTKNAIARADVALMPAFELESMPAECVDISFSSLSMSDLSSEAMSRYLKNIERMTRRGFLHIGKEQASNLISSLIGCGHASLKLAETRSSGWHSHKVSGAGVGGAAGLAASTTFEHYYVRNATASMHLKSKHHGAG